MKNFSYSVIILIILLFPAELIWGQDFRFAFITDLHVTKDSLAYNDLKRSVDQINATQGLSFVIVGGDLTEEGDRVSLNKVKSLLDNCCYAV